MKTVQNRPYFAIVTCPDTQNLEFSNIFGLGPNTLRDGKTTTLGRHLTKISLKAFLPSSKNVPFVYIKFWKKFSRTYTNFGKTHTQTSLSLIPSFGNEVWGKN